MLQPHFPTEPFDALIDFTTPVATKVYLEHSAKFGLIHVIGTTGFSTDDLALIKEKSKTCCIIRSGNMSLGVNLLAALVKKAAQSRDPSFDIEIVEMHHRMKIDAPSGTAYLLGEAAATGRQIALEDHSIRSRDGETGQRPEGSIGFATLRGGTVIGDHSVIFAGNGERIDKALHAIEEANIGKLRDVFQDISFNSNKLGDEQQKNDILRHLLEDFAKPELNLRESRVGELDVIGNAYEFLIKNFASTSGKKAGEFYTPPEVSTLMARLVDPQPGDEICDC